MHTPNRSKIDYEGLPGNFNITFDRQTVLEIKDIQEETKCLQLLANTNILYGQIDNIRHTINLLQKPTHAGVIGLVVSSLALHRGDPGSVPGFGSAYRQFRFIPKMEVQTCFNP